MATKRKAGTETIVHQPTLFEKIGEQASHLKDGIIAGKDHLVEIASEQLAAVKSGIKAYSKKKHAVADANKGAKKRVKAVAKKAVTFTKPVKKAAKKIAKKAVKTATKKLVGKAVKKAVAKKAVTVKKKVAAKKKVGKIAKRKK